jgi:hypothetical protein
MLAIVLDTNAVHSDPWLAGTPGKRLLELAARGSCVIVYPQVVIEELRRQRRRAADQAHKQATRGLSDMEKAGVDVSQTNTLLKASFDKIDTDLDNAFESVLKQDNVTSSPVPDVAAAAILKRDLAQRRPFIEVQVKQKPASVGFRDTLIWETVLAVLEQGDPSEKVVFVTADRGFLSDDSKSLHQDLLDDLDERQVDRDRVVSVKNIPNAIAEAEAASLRASQVTAATNALYELTDTDISLDGEYEYPDFVQFEVPAMEGAYISAIDQLTEFTIDYDPAAGSATATAEVVVCIEGAVYVGDWFADESETVTVSGELNNHYFEAASEVPAEAVVELDMSGDSPEAQSVVLRSSKQVTPQPR